MADTNRRSVCYTAACREIRDADLLLFRRGGGLVDRLIAGSGRSPYVHAAMAAWWRDDLMCLETLQLRDGRAVCLSTQVAQSPGCWDVYETNPDDRLPFDRTLAVQTMKRFTGTRYGWWNVLRVALRRLPIVRWLVQPVTDDLSNGHYPQFFACSNVDADARCEMTRSAYLSTVRSCPMAGTTRRTSVKDSGIPARKTRGGTHAQDG